ncbi:efflux transporter outer membrane subunit [Sulfurospirillum barnesii]|uniref:Efflux transporter, outer membrane factor lipoprotein, NodT family n=1 Tax=Sulfurospirillum barnesii (strain ATCC 700032 / DSM 10660 / SES-3) TaxID=760154 RepID=I3XWS4_SULBS|nr:efflux transporter outer membrane subunit [Sulfurospirillum barnesii]AFL68398.1 efflux transporter, outer membrane factor lipoprotein, NodT family [Sulfurospirillum barnesii SES-3]
MMRNFYALSLSVLVFGGCSLSPELSLPTTPFPESYRADMKSETTALNTAWWSHYGDEKLNGLIQEAFANNYDLQSAMVNISLARATLSSSTSNRYPSLDVEGSGRKYRSSADTFSSNEHNTYNSFGISAVLSYELDLWGKYKEAETSSRASLIASYAAKETVKISLAASVAESYFTLISLYEQLDSVKETIQSREEGLKRYAVQYQAGSITKATLLQEEAELRSAQISKDSLEQSIVTQQSALAVLVGKSPKEIAEFAKTSLPRVLPNDITVPSNLPSELLQNRPDIKQAEENLKAANANIGVARSAYFPSISLSGVLGYESTQLSNLVSSRSAMHNFGGSVASPLFNMGRTSSSVESAKANKELAEISYAQTVQKAFQESYDALNSRHILSTKLEHQKAYLDSMAQVFVLTKRQYEAGYGDYLALLDAKRNYLSAQLALIQVKQALLSSSVSLYKALGGGFDTERFSKETSAL